MKTILSFRFPKSKALPLARLFVFFAIALFLFSSRAWAATYYSQTSGSANTLANWNSNRLGGGTTPGTFTNNNDIFIIQNGHSMTTGATWNVNGNRAHIEIESGGILTGNNLINLATNGANKGYFEVDAGGTYIHNYTSTTANGFADDFPGYNANLVFDAASTVVIQKWANGGTAPVALLPEVYGNLIIDVATLGGSWSMGGGITSILGTLTIKATGGSTREVRLTNNTTTTIGIGGIDIQGGILNINNGTANPTINLTGNLSVSGTGMMISSGAGVPVLNFSSPSGIQTFSATSSGVSTDQFTWNAGTGATANIVQLASSVALGSASVFTVAAGAALDAKTFALSGAATFTLASGSTLHSGSPDGISITGTSTGNIQTTTARNYNTGANYVYDGTAPQVTGTGLPATVSSLKINNSGGTTGVTLTANVTASTLDLTLGLLTTGANAVTVSSGGVISNASSASYVSGILKRIYAATGSQTFPIGKGGNYRPLTFQYISLTGTSTVTAEQVETAITGTLPAGVNRNNSRTWNISQAGGSGLNYKVTLDGTGDAVTGTVVMLKKDGVGVISSNTATTPNYTNTSGFTTINTPTYLTLASACSMTANAGADITGGATCGQTTVTLAANTPTYGTGLWTVVSGTGGSFGTASSATSTFTGTAGTAYNLRWTITNGNCTSNDQVLVTFNRNPTTATNSSSQTICISGTAAVLGNAAVSGTGAWSVVSGPSTLASQFSSVTSPAAVFTPAGGAGSYVVRWTISNSPCTASTADATITVSGAPTTATNTSTQTICASGTAGLSGNIPTVGTGVWSVVSGPSTSSAQFSSTTNPAAIFTPAGGVGTYVVRWTTSNSPCTASTADATITVNPLPTTATNASTQSVCSGSTAVLAGNIPVIGIGSWSVVSGPSTSNAQFSNMGNPAATFTPAGGSGTYVVRWTISSSICSASTADATVTVGGAKTWNGTSWSPSAPTSIDAAVISGNYTTSLPTYPSITACTLTVNNSAVVTITSGFNVTLNGALTVSSGSFTLENNANLLQSANVSNSGNIIVKRNSSALKRQDYTLWSSPVAGQNLLSFSPQTITTRFYAYNTASNLYAAVTPSTTNFADATGYLIRMPNNHPTTATIWNGQFTGVPNNGNIAFTMSNTYNLVGNPYPSPIDVATFVSQNASAITGTLYFWRETNNNTTNNAYCTLAGGTFVGNGEAQVVNPNGVIQTGQGFFVAAKPGQTALNFNNSQRISNFNNQFFRNALTEERNTVWINATNTAGAFSQMAVGYITGATQGVDLFDGKAFADGDMAITSALDNSDYAIQGRALPFDAADVVPLNFRTATAGDYTIAIDHAIGLFGSGQAVYVKDNLMNETHNLAENPYTFASDAGTFNNRFELVYQETLTTVQPGPDFKNVVVYKQNHEVVINGGSHTIARVAIYDIRGRLLAARDNVNATEIRIPTDGTNGLLVTKITFGDATVVTKKVVN